MPILCNVIFCVFEVVVDWCRLTRMNNVSFLDLICLQWSIHKFTDSFTPEEFSDQQENNSRNCWPWRNWAQRRECWDVTKTHREATTKANEILKWRFEETLVYGSHSKRLWWSQKKLRIILVSIGGSGETRGEPPLDNRTINWTFIQWV